MPQPLSALLDIVNAPTKPSVWYETADSLYFLSRRDEEIRKWRLSHPCCCNTTLCHNSRLRSLHRITTFGFPSDVEERRLWLKALFGVQGTTKSIESIELPRAIQTLRASAVHFFPGDIYHNMSGGIRLRKKGEQASSGFVCRFPLFGVPVFGVTSGL